MKKLALLVAVGTLIGATAFAAEFIAPDRNGSGTVDLASNQTHKNLHVAGSVVQVNGPTTGDLVAAGGIVKISGSIENDLFLAGGRLDVDGQVGKNAHVAGGNLYFNKPVGGDLVAAGSQIEITNNAPIGGDLALAGGNITINSKVSGSVQVVAKRLTFGPNAQVTGSVNYKGPNEAIVESGAKVGTINFTRVANRGRGNFLPFLMVASVVKLLMLLAAAVVAAWLIPHKVQAVVRHGLAKPWANLGIGLLFVIFMPIVAFALMFTVIGLYIGLALLLSFLLFSLFAAVFMFFYTGALVWSWFKKNDPANRWRDLLVGMVVCIVLGLIPILGWIILGILWLLTVGALATYWYKEQYSN